MKKKVGSKWKVFDHTGKKLLGTHDTEKKANEQLRAIEAQKNKKGKK